MQSDFVTRTLEMRYSSCSMDLFVLGVSWVISLSIELKYQQAFNRIEDYFKDVTQLTWCVVESEKGMFTL